MPENLCKTMEQLIFLFKWKLDLLGVVLLFSFFAPKRSFVDIIGGSLYCQIFKFYPCFLGYSDWIEHISVDHGALKLST